MYHRKRRCLKKKISLGIIMFALSGDAGPLKCERMQTGERYGGSY